MKKRHRPLTVTVLAGFQLLIGASLGLYSLALFLYVNVPTLSPFAPGLLISGWPFVVAIAFLSVGYYGLKGSKSAYWLTLIGTGLVAVLTIGGTMMYGPQLLAITSPFIIVTLIGLSLLLRKDVQRYYNVHFGLGW